MPEASIPLTPPPHTGAALSRRHWCLGGAALLGLQACSLPRQIPRRIGADLVPFSASDWLGGTPDGWQTYVPRPDRPLTQYRLGRHDGRKAVHAVAHSSISGLHCPVDIDPMVRPWLHWEWRVNHCPVDATVTVDELDDSPARVVVAFDGDHAQLPLRDRLFEEQVALFTGNALPYATLAYVWDGQAELERVVAYPRSGRIRYLVVESGNHRAGHWQAYRRNLVDDYRRVFGTDPGRIISVGVQTDSDDLRNRVEAWYGDLSLR